MSFAYTTMNDGRVPPPHNNTRLGSKESLIPKPRTNINVDEANVDTFFNSDFSIFKSFGLDSQLLTCSNLWCSSSSIGRFLRAVGVHISLIYLSHRVSSPFTVLEHGVTSWVPAHMCYRMWCLQLDPGGGCLFWCPCGAMIAPRSVRVTGS